MTDGVFVTELSRNGEWQFYEFCGLQKIAVLLDTGHTLFRNLHLNFNMIYKSILQYSWLASMCKTIITE